MSIIFGFCGEGDAGIRRRDIDTLSSATKRYAADGAFTKISDRVAMGIQPYHTHERSRLDVQPFEDECGNLVTLDGRLDNYRALSDELDLAGGDLPDTLIILAAFRRWGEESFSRFAGDWAITLWSQRDRSLYLARDHAGTRTLYFEQKGRTIVWSTFLDSFFAVGEQYAVDMDFAARYLSGTATYDLTPFRAIRSVPAAHFVRFSGGEIARRWHWQPLAHRELRYRSDSDYDDQFLSLFRQSVQRRISNPSLIVAHLSGGMDSTSIVCMADRVLGCHPGAKSNCLRTLSYYDDSEPNWNERPFFSLVERRRGRSGIQIQSSFQDRTFRPARPEHLYLFPGADSGTIEQEEEINNRLGECETRVVLSGIGGDELLGGFPSPNPELGDLLVSGRVFRFVRQSLGWSIAQRKPVIRIWGQLAGFLRGAYFPLNKGSHSANVPWLCLSGGRENSHRAFIPGLGSRLTARPGTASAARTWWNMLETLPGLSPEFLIRREYRYPYLDRDLVEFLLAVPRDLLVRPGRRRYMMRRALRGIVPEEVLERKRKGYLDRGAILALQNARDEIRTIFSGSVLFDLGLINPDRLLEQIEPTRVELLSRNSFLLLRAVAYELWLRSNLSHISSIRAGNELSMTGEPRRLRMA